MISLNNFHDMESSIESWRFVRDHFVILYRQFQKNITSESSGLILIGVSNNLWEVCAQGFDGIDANQINCPYELCNTTFN